jgi:hypothetical protein
MCPGRHTSRNENGAPRLFYRSAGTCHRFGIFCAHHARASPRATVPVGVFREVRRLDGALHNRAALNIGVTLFVRFVPRAGCPHTIREEAGHGLGQW